MTTTMRRNETTSAMHVSMRQPFETIDGLPGWFRGGALGGLCHREPSMSAIGGR
jgi:hypothetical protein